MCNISLIIGLVIAAESTFLVAMGFIFASVATGSNPFTSAGSPVLCGVALGLVILTFGLISRVVSLLFFGPCDVVGPCAVASNATRGFVIALLGALTVLGVAIVVATPFSGIPIAGAAVSLTLGLSMLASAFLFAAIVNSLNAFERCLTASTSTSPGIQVATWLAVIAILVTVTVWATGAAGASPGCVGPNC
jgi:hypothetical protein